MSNVTNKNVNIYIDQAAAEAALEKLQSKADGFNKKVEEARQKQHLLNEEIKKIGPDGKGVEKLDADYKKLQKSIDDATKKLNDNVAAQQKLKQQIDSGMKPSFNQLTSLVSSLRNELKNMSESAPGYAEKFASFKKAQAELQRLQTAMNGVEKAQRSWMQEAKTVAFGVIIGNTVQAGAEAVLSYLKSFLSFKSEFQNSLANLSAITGATGTDLDFLRNKAVEFSKTGTRSAKEYVEAFKLIASAKPELLQQKELLAETTKAADLLSKASGIDLPEAATKLTDALNQFNEPASESVKYVDALAAGSKYGAAEVPQITDALLEFGTAAKSSNVSIYESTALIELLAEKGVKGAEAGTKLRNVFIALNATNALDKKALDQLEAAGVKTSILSNTSLSLKERLQELSKVQNNATALVQIFGKENFNAAQIVLKNIDRYAELETQVKETGVASAQAAVNTNTLSNNWQRLVNIISSKFLGGASDTLNTIVKSIADLASETNKADEAYKNLKTSTQDFNSKLDPLVKRYDELKGKTNLNTSEQKELRTIINKIVEILPQAATAFNEYGLAVDINRKKIEEFRKESADFLQKTGYKAIDSLKKDAEAYTKDIERLVKSISGITNNTKFAAGTDKNSVIEYQRDGQRQILEAQKKLLDVNEKLKNDYKTELPASLKKYLDAAKLAVYGTTDAAAPVAAPVNKNENPVDPEQLRKVQEEEARILKEREAERQRYYDLIAKMRADAAKEEVDDMEAAFIKISKEQEDNIKAIDKWLTKGVINAKEAAGAMELATRQALAKTQEAFDKAMVEHRKKWGTANVVLPVKPVLDDKAFQEIIKKANQYGNDLQNSLDRGEKLKIENDIAGAKNPKDKHKAIVASIEKAREEALSNATTVTEIEEINKKFNLQIIEENKRLFIEQMNRNLEYAQQALNIIDVFVQARTQKEKAAFDAEVRQNNKRKADIQGLADKQVISKIESARRIRAIELEEEKKKEELDKKQFERNKKMQLAQALISGAQAALKTFEMYGPPLPINPISIVAWAFTLANTAAQIGTIASSKFAKGGKLNGPLHSEGGMPVINPRTGRKEAEVEGGEYILSRATVANNRQLADSLLYSSMYNNGAPILPSWQTRSYKAINFGGFNATMAKAKYETGGVFAANNSNTATTQPIVVQSDDEMKLLMKAVIAHLQNPPTPVVQAEFSLKKLDDARYLDNYIKKEASPT